MLELITTTMSYFTKAGYGPDGKTPAADLVLGANGQPQRVFLDRISGQYYLQIAETLPSSNDPDSQAKRKAILAQNPIHYASDQSGITGFYVPVQGPQIPVGGWPVAAPVAPAVPVAPPVPMATPPAA